MTYLRIPKDRCNEWLETIKRPSEPHPVSSRRICSEHFAPESYLNVPGKLKTLKANAIPTLKLKSQLQMPMRETGRIKKHRKRKILIPSSSDSEGLRGVPKKRRKLLRMFHNYSLSPRKMKQNLSNIKEQKSKILNRLKVSEARVKRLTTKITHITHLKEVLKVLNRKNMISDESLTILKNTVNHIPYVLMRRLVGNLKRKKTNKAPFPPELRSFAMTLQFYSSKAYEYLRKTFNLALPALSTIRSWLSNIHCEPGFAQTAFGHCEEK